MSNQAAPAPYKFLLIGDSGTGKTALVLRFSDQWSDNTTATIGLDVCVRPITYEGQTYKLALFDTAGQERFRSMGALWYRGAKAMLYVYSVTDLDSFNNIQRWIDDSRQHSNNPHLVGMLVGNKIDLVTSPETSNARQVPTEMARELAQRNGLLFIECSAKTSINVVEAFEDTFHQVIQQERLLAMQNKDGYNNTQSQGGLRLDGPNDGTGDGAGAGGGCC